MSRKRRGHRRERRKAKASGWMREGRRTNSKIGHHLTIGVPKYRKKQWQGAGCNAVKRGKNLARLIERVTVEG